MVLSSSEMLVAAVVVRSSKTAPSSAATVDVNMDEPDMSPSFKLIRPLRDQVLSRHTLVDAKVVVEKPLNWQSEPVNVPTLSVSNDGVLTPR